MNELLISEIKSEDKELLQKLILIEEAVFGEQVHQQSRSSVQELATSSTDASLDVLETIIDQCVAVINEIESPLERAECLLNELYFQHLFIDYAQASWPLSAYHIAKGLKQRLMSPIVKAAIVAEIITACGFDTDLVFVPNKIMVRLCCDEQYAIIFDAVTGESLDWTELDHRLDDLSGDPGDDNLKSVNDKIAIVEYLISLKSALIREQAFDKALTCIDIILGLNPDDPILRRDRGFLLHQLDCFKVAVDDYRYFVEQCPQDPAAKILKIQLEKIDVQNNTFH
ncbi:tetratricopeptide repeat protein [Colwellia sp. D2M02]|uniref:Invasion regulator SirB1 n=1 Tax=Colwellia asteriadis TaxID=517723 RepID=A0ABN1L6D0_9GAMM|nr:tetratricopeptide repeat protein [Colwellia sp. D2M02]MBU2893977.1 tetratricopeptide repeat protein [Colwellia sp. D2M02]